MKLTAFHLTETHPDSLLRSIIGRVSAGHPVEIVGEEELIDLNFLVSRGSSDTRIIMVEGSSMEPEVCDGDFVVIACDREPKPNQLVIAGADGEFTLKRFKLNNGHRRGLYLVPTNPDYTPREVLPAHKVAVYGVVTHIVRRTA